MVIQKLHEGDLGITWMKSLGCDVVWRLNTPCTLSRVTYYGF